MSGGAVILFLSLGIFLLLCIVIYQQVTFRTGTQKSLREIHMKLKQILDTDSDERVMVFTENRELMELAAQINRLLENLGKHALCENHVYGSVKPQRKKFVRFIQEF